MRDNCYYRADFEKGIISIIEWAATSVNCKDQIFGRLNSANKRCINIFTSLDFPVIWVAYSYKSMPLDATLPGYWNVLTTSCIFESQLIYFKLFKSWEFIKLQSLNFGLFLVMLYWQLIGFKCASFSTEYSHFLKFNFNI